MPAPPARAAQAAAFPPPYPKDTAAKGWPFLLYLDELERSDAWLVAGAHQDMRPWLLMLWVRAWQQVPAGSIPADDEVIAAMIGMPLAAFMAARSVLLRGWYRCSDNRLYHPVMVERGLEMVASRTGNHNRVRRFRTKRRQEKDAAKNQVEQARDHNISAGYEIPVFPKLKKGAS